MLGHTVMASTRCCTVGQVLVVQCQVLVVWCHMYQLLYGGAPHFQPEYCCRMVVHIEYFYLSGRVLLSSLSDEYSWLRGFAKLKNSKNPK